MPQLELDGLTRRYGSLTALDDLSFAVTPGHVTGFLGPNGAGKSTTMRMILGAMKVSNDRKSDMAGSFSLAGQKA